MVFFSFLLDDTTQVFFVNIDWLFNVSQGTKYQLFVLGMQIRLL